MPRKLVVAMTSTEKLGSQPAIREPEGHNRVKGQSLPLAGDDKTKRRDGEMYRERNQKVTLSEAANRDDILYPDDRK